MQTKVIMQLLKKPKPFRSANGQREPLSVKQQNNFKPQNIMFTIKIVQTFSSESVYIRKK